MSSLSEGRAQEPQPVAGAEASRRSNPNPCPVVALGASAGGLEVFQEFFRQVPPDSGAAFVLIQHLSPHHETLIPELLAPFTSLPVRQVADETVVEANQIYVMPPNVTLTIDDCVLYVTKPARSQGRRSPIDRFFRSLAEDQEDDAIGVILSGTGTDGALGLRAIKERGGTTLAQSPETAHYDSMPRSAILTGMVDYVLPVPEMPGKIFDHLGRRRKGGEGSPAHFREEVTGHLGKICALLRRATGHDFRHYKQSTLVRRVRRRLQESRAGSVDAYVDLLSRNAGEVERLFRDLLIGVTHFFRDQEAFESLAAKVVPRLFNGKDADGSVRVWVPGCATGEEAYSLAILLREQAAGLETPPQILIFATDIDAQAVEAARQAWYPESIAQQVSPERLERFFVKHGNMYQVTREIREMCLFSVHNLITDPPFSRLDLVSCRNLLIYLEGDLQKKILALFHYALRPGGFLFLGPSETVTGKPELFRTVAKAHRIYQSRDTLTRLPLSFPLVERGRVVYRHADEPPRRGARQQEVARAFESVLLENYAPACVVVNEWGDAVYFSPRTGRYLEPAPGAPSANVVDMARKGLRLDLRTALHKAVSSRVLVARENVAFELEGKQQRINLQVRPLPELGEDPGLFMVVFQDLPATGEAEPDGAALSPDNPTLRRLEAELRATKDHLQATLEELESSNEELIASNEELLSMNEELQSANEELQTSKEELQSVNEELESVNTELRKKIAELDRANSDLQNLFQSTRIATLFVDRELRIKKFTPAVTELFRLIDGDLGRPVADVAPRFRGADLAGDSREVLRTLSPCERQVRLEDGSSWYLLRILPYRTVEDVIDGVVINFLDITELKRTEEALRHSEGRLRTLVDSGMLGVLISNGLGDVLEANDGFLKLLGWTREELRAGKISWRNLTPPEFSPLDEAGIAEAIARGACTPYEKEYLRRDGQRVPILIGYALLEEGTEGNERYICFILDLTQRKRLEEELRRRSEQLVEADHRKDEFLAMLGHELRNPLAPIRNCLHILQSPGATEAQTGKAIRTIDRQVLHLTRLVDDLLDIARISRGKVLLRRQRMDMVETVRATVEDQRPELEKGGLELALDLPESPLWVHGDSTRLSQAVGNVLHNAAKFTERGGRVEVSVQEEPEGDGVLVKVRDTGIGMDPNLIAGIFEPFRQADAGPDRSRGGLGLGLALVKGLTLLHGGWVRASSPGPGKGSEITLQLPLATGMEEATMAEDTRAQGPERSRRCLVIEDHADAAESMALLLRLIGHEAEVAFDAAQGLEAAHRFQPEVVLCDIGLPGAMDGYAAARAFRADPKLRSAFLIALTGYGQEEDRRKALEAGFDAHLTKPADLEALRRLLAEARPA